MPTPRPQLPPFGKRADLRTQPVRQLPGAAALVWAGERASRGLRPRAPAIRAQRTDHDVRCRRADLKAGQHEAGVNQVGGLGRQRVADHALARARRGDDGPLVAADQGQRPASPPP